MKRKLLCLFLILLLLPTALAEEAPAAENTLDNGILRLTYAEEPASIQLTDLRSGEVWSSRGTEAATADMKFNNTWKAKIDSLFNVTFTGLNSKNREQTMMGVLGKLKYDLNCEIKDDALWMNFYLKKPQIYFSLVFSLDQDALLVRVPFESIIEETDSKLVSLELMPFFGAVPDGVEGFLFYPDGCGALMDFQKSSGTRKVSPYWLNVYNTQDYKPFQPSVQSAQGSMTNQADAMLPVFGVKRADTGFLAIIEGGDETAMIGINPSGVGVNLNRIAPKVDFRRVYEVNGSDVKIDGGDNSLSRFNVIENEAIPGDRTIRYIFLNGEETRYDAMAVRYRKYLDERSMLPKAGKQMPGTALTLVMSATVEQPLFDEVLTVTSYQQALEIIKAWPEENGMNLILKGWSAGGFGQFPQPEKMEKALGSQKEFEALLEACEAKGVQVYLDFNVLDVERENGGFSAGRDVMLDGNRLPYGDKNREFALFNHQQSLLKFQRMADRFASLGTGAAIWRLGDALFDDYHSDFPGTKKDALASYRQIFSLSNEKFRHTAIEGGNQYGLPYADWLLRIPDSDTGFLITTRTIPFFQIVTHGRIAYTGDAVNLFYNHSMQSLKMAELGYTPYFELTWIPAVNLRETKCNMLFSSQWESWQERAGALCQRFAGLEPIRSSAIMAHQRITDTLVRVDYENGYRLWVNYAEEAAETADGEVPPEEFLLIAP